MESGGAKSVLRVKGRFDVPWDEGSSGVRLLRLQSMSFQEVPMNARYRRLQVALQRARLQAIALNPGPSLTYLTGLHFHLMERPVVAFFTAEGQQAVVLPRLEAPKVAGRDALQPFFYGDDPSQWQAAFREAIAALGLERARIGVEPTRLRVLELRYLEAAAPHAVFPSAEEVLADLRVVKDADELAAMQRAVDIAQRALEAALAGFRAGMTERELAAEVVVQLLRHGSEPDLPFQPIVAAGPNAANPHAVPTERPIQRGDLLIIDWGATWEGYFSDLTRTFAVGEVDEELARIAAVAAQANAAGRAAARAGISAGEVDAAARSVIAAAGYGAYFTHRTGHGLGLDVHERPFIFGGNDEILRPGMTFTVEPGIYLPGRGGARVEDDVVITAEGARSLSDLPRALRRLE